MEEAMGVAVPEAEAPSQAPVVEAAPAKGFWEEARERARKRREERGEKWKDRMERLKKAKDNVLDVMEMARDPKVREAVTDAVVEFGRDQATRVKNETIRIAKETGQAVGGAVKELATGAAVVGLEAASVVGDPVLWVAGKTVLPALEHITDATGFVAEKVASGGANILGKVGEIEVKSREKVIRRKNRWRGFFEGVVEAADRAGFSGIRRVAEGARNRNERSIQRAEDRLNNGRRLIGWADEVRGFAQRLKLASERVATGFGAVAEVATSAPIGSVIER